MAAVVLVASVLGALAGALELDLQVAVGLASAAGMLALNHAAPRMLSARWARSLRRFLDVIFVVGWLVTVTVTSVSYWQDARLGLEMAQYCETHPHETVCRR